MSTRTWHVPRNRSGPRNFVRCRRLLQRREAAIAKVGSPEQLQRDLRGPFAQPTPSAAPPKNRGRRKLVFSSLFASQTTRAPIRSRLRSEDRSLYPRRCCPCGAPHNFPPIISIQVRFVHSYYSTTKKYDSDSGPSCPFLVATIS